MKKINLIAASTIATFSLAALPAKAVCPVCIVAVGAGLGLSQYLGIDDTISGVWIGGLTAAVAAWTINWFNKKNWSFGSKSWRDVITDSIRGRNKRVYVHHFGAFIREGRGRGMHEEIRHLDGNAAHNAPCNLKYGTRKENVADKIIHRKRKLELKEELKERKKGTKN
jgi:hypothetical protein